MATYKAKRSIHLAQPQPQHAKTARSGDPKAGRHLNTQPAATPMPVKAAVYRALAELNAGFDKAIHQMGNLKRVYFLRTDELAGMHEQLREMRARANHELLSAMSGCEAANAGHLERLRLTPRNETTPPFAAG